MACVSDTVITQKKARQDRDRGVAKYRAAQVSRLYILVPSHLIQSYDCMTVSKCTLHV